MFNNRLRTAANILLLVGIGIGYSGFSPWTWDGKIKIHWADTDGAVAARIEECLGDETDELKCIEKIRRMVKYDRITFSNDVQKVRPRTKTCTHYACMNFHFPPFPNLVYQETFMQLEFDASDRLLAVRASHYLTGT